MSDGCPVVQDGGTVSGRWDAGRAAKLWASYCFAVCTVSASVHLSREALICCTYGKSAEGGF